MPNETLIAALNDSLNRELSTIIRYVLQGSIICGRVNQPVRDLYIADVADEIGHAQYLADKIVMLGGKPFAQPDLTPPPNAVDQMIANDIGKEEDDVAQYKKLAKMAEEAGDIELKLKMEEQAADESRHAQELRRLGN